MGLAYDTISVNRIVPPFYNMINQGLLDQNLFTFWLGDANDGEGAPGGEAVFGGIDPAHYEGKITYAPIRRKGYWEVELEKVRFGTEEMELENTVSLPLIEITHMTQKECRVLPLTLAHL